MKNTSWKFSFVLIMLISMTAAGCALSSSPTPTPFLKDISETLVMDSADTGSEISGEENTAQEESSEQPPAALFSPEGSWLLMKDENGIWGMNPNGTGMTQLAAGKIVAPQNLTAGYRAPYLAFVTADDLFTLQNLTLHIISVPDGQLVKTIPLTSSETEPGETHEMCDPRYEAARAVMIGDGLSWNKTGTKLAFVGSLEGPSSDVYLYSLEDDQISRLTDGEGQAYNLHWSESDQYLVHFGASCFGTGAGFNLTGVWAVDTNTNEVIDLYDPSESSVGETWIGNYWSAEDSFYVTSWGKCMLEDLRLVTIADGDSVLVHEGCVWDYALGPTGLVAVITDSMFSDQPGVYVYGERNAAEEFPVLNYIPLEGGREIELNGGTVFVKVRSENSSNPEVLSFDLFGGESSWYSGVGEIPWIGPLDQSTYAWVENGKLYLQGDSLPSPVLLSEQGGYPLLWIEDILEDDITTRFFFGESEPRPALYMAASPDYRPELIAEVLIQEGDLIHVR